MTWLLVLWLPTQAVAVPLLAGSCHTNPAAIASHSVAAQPEGDPVHHAAHRAEAQPHDVSVAGEGASGDPQAGHYCCAHFTALPGSRAAPRDDAPGVDLPAPELVLYHVYPEPQRRPPRA
ncbi:MAG: hypothetical protein MUC34_00155 [Anaerolineae bacterium]|nr:hypothetical protein [Anaerolineae bacterium]